MFSEQVGEIIIAVDGDEEDNGKHYVTFVSLKFKVQISLSLFCQIMAQNKYRICPFWDQSDAFWA